MSTQEQIQWLNSFIAQWGAVGNDKSLSLSMEVVKKNALGAQLEAFCIRESLPIMSADDLLVTLMNLK